MFNFIENIYFRQNPYLQGCRYTLPQRYSDGREYYNVPPRSCQRIAGWAVLIAAHLDAHPRSRIAEGGARKAERSW